MLASVIAFLAFLLFYVVDIEVGRAKVYFFVGNRAKMGVGRFGVMKYSLWGQNDVVLGIIYIYIFLNSADIPK